jgi:hypothetical protein
MGPIPKSDGLRVKLSIDYYGSIRLNYCKTGVNSQTIKNESFATPIELDGYISGILESCTEPADFSVNFTDRARSHLESMEPEYCSRISEKLGAASGRAADKAATGG